MQPIAFKDIDPALTKKRPKPVCTAPKPKKDVTGALRVNAEELQAWGDCNQAAVDDIYARLTGLQRSVVARQLAGKKAVEASKL